MEYKIKTFQNGDFIMKQTIIVLAGMPGAGKSTIGLALSRALGIPMLDKDTLKATLLAAGIEEQVAAPTAYELFFALARDLVLLQGQSVILDSPTIFPRILDNARALANEVNGTIKIIGCRISFEARQQRLATRVGKVSQLSADPTPDSVAADRFAYLPPDTLWLDTDQPLAQLLQIALPYVTTIQKKNGETMPDKIRDPRMAEIAEQGVAQGLAAALGEAPTRGALTTTQKYGEHLGNYIDHLTEGLRTQLRATKPTVLLFMDSFPAGAVNETVGILAGEGVAVTLICRVYYPPTGQGSPESITDYINRVVARFNDLIAQPLVEQAYRDGRLWVKLFNETNIGIEGFPQGRVGFAPALAAWQRAVAALRPLFPPLKIGSLANTPGNDDTYFYGDLLNLPYWYHGPEAAKENPTPANIAAAKASCPMRPMFEAADGIFTHMYAPETRMTSGELQRWYSRRFEQYLKFLPANKPMFICECDAGYDDGPQSRANGVVWWLRNVIDVNERVGGVCIWWNAAPGEGDPIWTKHYTRDAQGNFAPLVAAVAVYRNESTPPAEPPPPTEPPRTVAFAGLPLQIEPPPALQVGEKYWFARRIEVQTPEHSGGSHAIFVRTFRNNSRVTGITVRVFSASGSSTGATQARPLTERGDYQFTMAGQNWNPAAGAGRYNVTIAQGKSETIRGMGMPFNRNYSLIVEFEELTMQPPTTDPQLVAKLHAAGDAAQVLELNPRAALQKEIFRRNFVPNSPEFTVQHAGKSYVGQRAENLANGKVAIAWVEHGIWDVVHWEER